MGSTGAIMLLLLLVMLLIIQYLGIGLIPPKKWWLGYWNKKKNSNPVTNGLGIGLGKDLLELYI